MSKILVLQGPPASGKSTYARGLIKNNKEWVIVSRDSIRESRGDYWVPEQEDYVSSVEELQIRSAIRHLENKRIKGFYCNWNEYTFWISENDFNKICIIEKYDKEI